MIPNYNLVRIIFFLSIITISTTVSLYAQGGKLNTKKEASIIDSQNGSATIDEIKLPPPSIEGSFYINESWMPGDVSLSTGMTIKNCGLKFDLENNILEIKIDEVVKVSYAEQYSDFQWHDLTRYDTINFINCNQFDFTDNPVVGGVFEIVTEGDYSLFIRHYSSLLKPTYAPTVAMGNRNYKVIKKSDFYIEKNGMVTKITNGKMLYSFFGSYADETKQFAKKNKLKTKSRNDLMIIIEYYNSLDRAN